MNPNSTLLPIGQEITHNNRSLTIVKLISSSGWTSEVYQGTLGKGEEAQTVAIKVMKDLSLPMARQLFESEGLTLADLMYHEEEASKEQRFALKVAPMYYGMFEYQGASCLVMEFIEGTEVSKILEKQGVLPEFQALTIAWHLNRTLDILHTRLKKTYIDLKFEDLWWLPGKDSSKGQLKLIDFGTLEGIKPGDENPRGVRRDILLAGVYLCGMLTGHMPGYSLGELTERAETIIDKGQMSWGVRRLLRRLLHRNPIARPASAAVVATELRTLVSFWEQSVERLVEIAENNLARASAETEAQSDKAREYASRAMMALDIAKQQTGDEERFKNPIERARGLLLMSDYVSRGRIFFDGRTFSDAKKIFVEGVHWSENPAELRRWAYLASIGLDINPDQFDKLKEEAIKALERQNEGNWQAAIDRWELLKSQLDSKGLQALLADARMFLAIESAEASSRRQDFAASARFYRQALNELPGLPDADFIRQEEVGDLRSQAEEMEALEATRGQAAKLLAEAAQALAAGNEDEAVEKAKDSYWKDRTSLENRRRLAELTQSALGAGRFRLALKLGEIGLKDWPVGSELAKARSLASLFWKVEQAALLNDSRELERLLRSIFSTPEFSDQTITISSAEFIIRRAVERARQAGDIDTLTSLPKLVTDLRLNNLFSEAGQWSTAANQLRQKQLEEFRQTVDRLMTRAVILADLENPAEVLQLVQGESLIDGIQRLRDREFEVDQVLADAARVARDIQYRQEEIAQMQAVQKARRESHLERQVAMQNQRALEQKTRWQTLENRWQEINALHQWIHSEPNNQIQGVFWIDRLNEYKQRLQAFIEMCYDYLGAFGKEPEDLQERIRFAINALDGAAPESWTDLQNQATARLSEFQKAIREVTDDFEAGRLQAACAGLERWQSRYGATQGWRQLKERIFMAVAWKEWLVSNSEVLDNGRGEKKLLTELRKYGASDLPEFYKRIPKVQNYLQKARYLINQSMSGKWNERQSPDFLEMVGMLIELADLERYFGKDGSHVAA